MEPAQEEKKVVLHFLVPAWKVNDITKVVSALGGIIEGNDDELELNPVPLEDVFPEITPGEILKGLRLRDGLAQASLAEKIQGKQSHISEIERGQRPIGRALAKKLAKVFKENYKLFL